MPAPCWRRLPSWSSLSSSSSAAHKGSSRRGAEQQKMPEASRVRYFASPIRSSPGNSHHTLRQLYSRNGLLAIAAVYGALVVLVPLLNLAVPRTSVFHVSDYSVAVAGKILCYAMVALALDLIWGYTGILSLGHGLFFALGGYAIGMYLMREIGNEGQYGSDLPDFMVFLDWHQLPWYWQGTQHLAYALLLVVLVPAVVAWVFGFFTFRSRVKGVYLSIITQAM